MPIKPTKKTKKQAFDLNENQTKTVQHKTGPLLVVAGAGTGKTRVITERIKHLITAEKVKPSEILALTFTEKAASEMLNRLGDVMPLGYEEPWVYTFHSFADRLLRTEGIEIGLDPGYKILSGPDQWILLRRNIFKMNLEYFRPLGNPTKFIGAFLKFISRLQDENISPSDFAKYVKTTTFESEEETKRFKELSQIYTRYTELKLENSRMDFGDLITWTLELFKQRPNILKKYQNQFKHVLLDEFQDTNYAQYDLVKMLCPTADLKEKKRSLITVGDDSQCLPPNAKISTLNGCIKIKDIKAGTTILTAVGKGHTSVSQVTRVFCNEKKAQLLTFTTEDGKKLTVTDNHKMFCFLPTHHTHEALFFVYLMHQKNMGWRIGITKSLPIRLRLEYHADSIFALGTFKTEQEARFYESYYAAKYGLPTVTFRARPGQSLEDEWLNKLFKSLDTKKGAQQIAKDFGLELDSPVFCVDAVTRGVTARLKVNLLMCHRNYRGKTAIDGFLENPKIVHLVHMETFNAKAIHTLEKNGFSLQKAKKGKRFRLQTTDLRKAWEVAERIAKLTGAFIDKKFQVGRYNYQHLPSRIVPASHIVPGVYVPVLNGKSIEYKMVVSRKETIKTLKTYDLEVNKTHNFITDGVVVHNSIYKFRGAAVSNILQFMEDYPESEMITLLENYRSSQKILDPAYKLIQNNNPDTLESKLGISKKLVSMVDQKSIEPLIIQAETLEDEVEIVVQKILEILANEPQYTYKDIAILARANSHLDPFVMALRKYGLPYQLVGNRGLYDQDEVRDVIALLKVILNPKDNISMYRVLNIGTLGIPLEEISELLTTSRYKKLDLAEAMNLSQNSYVISLNEKLKEFQENITKVTPTQLVYNLANSIDYIDQFTQEETIENQLAIKNLNLFLNIVKRFEVDFHEDNKTLPTIIDFVDYLDLIIDAGDNPAQAEIEDIDTINLMTVHASKGLEFPVVFMINLVADRFPTRNKSDTLEIPNDLIKETLPTGDEHLQEERRLFYVGMTRACKYLYMACAKNYGGKREKVPSGYLQETGVKIENITPNQLKANQTQTGLFGVESGFRSPRPTPINEAFKPDSLSFTQMDTFLTCPLKYKYSYVLRIPTAPNHALSFGITIHEVLRDFHIKKMFDEDISLEQLMAVYKDKWQPLGYLDENHRALYFESGKKLLENYYEKNNPIKVKHLGLEKPFTLRLNGIKFYGKIDRIDENPDGGVEIIDYKTGQTKTQKDVDKDAQVSIYAIAAKEAFGLNPTLLSYYFVESGQKLSTTRTPEQLAEQKEQIFSVMEDIKKGNFEATPGMHCNWCDYRDICPYAYKG